MKERNSQKNEENLTASKIISPNFGKNKTKIATAVQNDEDIKNEETGNDERVACSVCQRKFMHERIEKHEEACKKSHKKRPVFETRPKKVHFN